MCWLHPQMFLGCKNRRVKSKLEKRVAPNTVGFHASRANLRSSTRLLKNYVFLLVQNNARKIPNKYPKKHNSKNTPQKNPKKIWEKKTQIRLPFTCRHWLPSHALGADGFEGGRVQQLPRPTSASPGPESSTCGKVNTTGKFVTCGRHLCLYNLKCVTK